MPKHTKPPVYLAVDLWMAMGMDSREFDAYYDRNGWADTWANLLAHVRRTYGRLPCRYAVEDGEDCVLMNGHTGPHMGASDVGSSEPLPLSTHPSERHPVADVDPSMVYRPTAQPTEPDHTDGSE
jgi:hypothetical protein